MDGCEADRPAEQDLPHKTCRSAPIRRAQAEPLVAHLPVVDRGIVIRHAQTESIGVQPSDRGEQRIGRNDAVALRRDQQ